MFAQTSLAATPPNHVECVYRPGVWSTKFALCECHRRNLAFTMEHMVLQYSELEREGVLLRPSPLLLFHFGGR